MTDALGPIVKKSPSIALGPSPSQLIGLDTRSDKPTNPGRVQNKYVISENENTERTNIQHGALMPAEASASNARTADGLSKTQNLSALIPHAETALKTGGVQGLAENKDLTAAERKAARHGVMMEKPMPLDQGEMQTSSKDQGYDWSSDLNVLRSGEMQGGIELGRKLDQLAKTTPEVLTSMPEELRRFQKGYSSKRHSNYMQKTAPDPESKTYKSDKRHYDQWVVRREKEAQYEGLKKAASVYNGRAFSEASAKATVKIVNGVRTMSGSPLNGEPLRGIDAHLKAREVPIGYREMPGIAVNRGLGNALASVGTLVAAPFEAAGAKSGDLARDGASKKSQIAHAYGYGALNLAPGLAAKLNALPVREYFKLKSGRDLLAPLYDNAILGAEALGGFVGGLGMDKALDGGRKKDRGRHNK